MQACPLAARPDARGVRSSWPIGGIVPRPRSAQAVIVSQPTLGKDCLRPLAPAARLTRVPDPLAPAPPDRPADDDVVATTDALAWQAHYCRTAGSPVAAAILDAVRRDVGAGGPLADELPGTVRFGDLIGLRVMAAVHRLALQRRAPRVALCLPTVGGTAPAAGSTAAQQFEADVVEALVTNDGLLAAMLAWTPQTNETGRAALLRLALSWLGPALPVRLREIGASAGLNLRADALPGHPELEFGPLPSIIERRGCDLHPVDPTSADGRTLLSSYIWVDDVERFARLGRALTVAREVPAVVVQQDAGEFVESLDLVPGTLTVLWHSAMWVYLPPETKSRVLAGIDAVAAGATATQPFAHVAWEWSEARAQAQSTMPFELTVRLWSGRPEDGRREILAVGMSHGEPFERTSAVR